MKSTSITYVVKGGVFLKNTMKIIFKMFLLLAFFCVTPLFKGMAKTLGNSNQLLNNFVYSQKAKTQSISLKSHLNVLGNNENLTIPKAQLKVETTQEDPQVVPNVNTSVPKNQDGTAQKKVYIYNTHQDEKYQDGKTVMDAGAILAKSLEDKGIKVVLETNDFIAYQKQNNLNYNNSYVVSYKYLNDALVNYGGFDLCIDLHRDSIPRSASFKVFNNKKYATAMMVVGGLGKNAPKVNQISTTLTDIINASNNGIMRSIMNREAYYNQEVNENIVLMEIGGDVNTFDEISETVEVIAQGIQQYLGKET